MSENTAIEWCDSTFNPWMGCTPVSPACDDCYAARSTPARTLGVAWGAGQERRRTSEANWRLPLQWERNHAEFEAEHGRRRRVFCASLADVFDNEVPVEWRRDLFALIEVTPHLDWLLLTKRVGNVTSMLRELGVTYLPSHVWLGATVVNQAEFDRDIGKLDQAPAAVRFLSVEPMLGPIVDRDGWLWGTGSRNGIDWVICGGESGPKARPMHPDWARSLRDQCAAAGVPFLFKQWGEWIEPDLYGANTRLTVREGDPEFESAAAAMDGFLCADGRFASSIEEMAENTRYLGMLRIGKKAAGRQLDGVTHDGFPGAAP